MGRVSQSVCCSLCTNDSRCRTAVYSPQGECHLHDATDSAHPFADRGWTLMIKKTQTIVDLAVATPDLSTLVAALKAGGLVDTLSGKGPFTVFAPTNEAFAALPAGTLANLLKPENKAQLVDLLTYHVVSGDVHAKDITDMEMIKTVEGKNVTARVTSGGILINSAKGVTADVDASNGVIHIIDAVLMPGNPPKPASKTIVDIAVANADLSTLVTALKAGGLVKTLEGKGPFTVFAPTNEAFDKLPAATLAHLLDPANVKELDAVLTYHVWRVLLPSRKTSQTVRRSRLSRARMWLRRSTWEIESSSTTLSSPQPMLPPPTVSFILSTQFLVSPSPRPSSTLQSPLLISLPSSLPSRLAGS